MWVRILAFLILNFGALGIGVLFTGKGVVSDWYQNLDKAPWTPPGWVFGAAWTTIMLLFTVYMALLWDEIEDKPFLIRLFVAQWLLNVIWNPTFFYFKLTSLALLFIVSLTFLVGFFLFFFLSKMGWKSLLLSPYFVWMIIATSLNFYAVLKN